MIPVARITIHPLPRPEPAENPASQADRDQAVREWRHYQEWRWELELEHEDGGVAVLYGQEARAWLAAWLAAS